MTVIPLCVYIIIPYILLVVLVVCPLQPSLSANPGCPGPESSVLVSSQLACPISSQVTNHWGERCNRTGEVHPVDPFHSLDNLKNHFVSIAFYRNSAVYNVLCRLDKRVSSLLKGVGRLLSTLLSLLLLSTHSHDPC